MATPATFVYRFYLTFCQACRQYTIHDGHDGHRCLRCQLPPRA